MDYQHLAQAQRQQYSYIFFILCDEQLRSTGVEPRCDRLYICFTLPQSGQGEQNKVHERRKCDNNC